MSTFVFLLKRVMFCAAVITAASIFILGIDLFFIFGVLGGALLSVGKAALYGTVPVLLSRNSHARIIALIGSILAQFITVALLFVAVKLNVRLFFGISAGLVTTAFFICINAVTEKLGITHNRWGGLD